MCASSVGRNSAAASSSGRASAVVSAPMFGAPGSSSPWRLKRILNRSHRPNREAPSFAGHGRFGHESGSSLPTSSHSGAIATAPLWSAIQTARAHNHRPRSWPSLASSWVVSLVAGYIRFQALDTDTVSDTAEQLIADYQIRDQIAATLVDALYMNVDVAAALEPRLPSDREGLAGPISAGLARSSPISSPRGCSSVRNRLRPSRASTVTRAHRQLITSSEDDTGPDQHRERRCSRSTSICFVVQLGDRVAVVGNVAEQLGPDAGRIEILQADQLETAQDLTRLLKFLGTWLGSHAPDLGRRSWLAAAGGARSCGRSVIGTIVIGLLVLALRRARRVGAGRRARSSVTVQPAAHNAWASSRRCSGTAA